MLIDEQDIQSQDPPFLNRFEKQLLNFKTDLNKEDIELADKVDNFLSKALYPEGKESFLLSLDKIFYNFSIEDLCAVIYFLKVRKEVITNLKVSLGAIVRLATGDILLAIKMRETNPNISPKIKFYLEKLRELYFLDSHESLGDYLDHRVKKKF